MIDLSLAAVTQRLRQVAGVCDLCTDRRLRPKTGMDAAMVTRRLRSLSRTRDLCLRLAAVASQQQSTAGRARFFVLYFHERVVRDAHDSESRRGLSIALAWQCLTREPRPDPHAVRCIVAALDGENARSSARVDLRLHIVAWAERKRPWF